MGRRLYQKTVMGTVVVVSLVWFSITILIVMYHEELMKSRRLREYNQEFDRLDEIHNLGPFLGKESDLYPDNNRQIKIKHYNRYEMKNMTINTNKTKDRKVIVANMNQNKEETIRNDIVNPEKKSQFIQKLKDTVNVDSRDVDKANVGEDKKSDSYPDPKGAREVEKKNMAADKPEVPEININKVAEVPNNVPEVPQDLNNVQAPEVKEKQHEQEKEQNSEPKINEQILIKQSGEDQKNEQEPKEQREQIQEKAAKMAEEVNPMEIVLQQIQNVIKDVNVGNPVKPVKMLNKKPTFVNPLGLDFDSIEPRAAPGAPGEMGYSYVIEKNNLPPAEKAKYEEMFEKHQFSKYVSDMISVRRRLADKRLQSCKDVVYDKPLPSTSIIICFHNEAWSVLLRTIWSIMDRSPLNLIKEIILVDDFSSSDELKKPLEDYMAKLKIVKIVRTKKREGLIRARLLGYSVATGDVLTFLDSHCECLYGWLEPLLTRIAENHTRAVTPIINSIGLNAFGVDQNQAHSIGILHLENLSFHWDKIPEREEKRRTSPIDPYRSPTMAGGIFAISKAYFEHIGLYDAGMEIWGGENVEMSIRLWTCGGSIELHPCSHVAHVFRFKSPYSWGKDPQVILKKNTLRVAEVWLDEHRFHFYEEMQYRLGNFGDVSERKALRQRLQCKPFSWYIKNVYPEAKIPEAVLFSGEIRNVAYDRCLDNMGVAPTFPKAQHCHGLGGNQYYRYYQDGNVRMGTRCLVVRETGNLVTWNNCSRAPLRFWDYTENGHLVLRGTNLCLDLTEGKQKVQLNNCSSSKTQQWTWTRNLEDLISGKMPYLGTGVRNKFIQ